MIAFEIHTFVKGTWKVDAIFDDRELAISEAERMDAGGRYSGVRVIEELFDEDTNKTSARTIFSGTKVDNAKPSSKSKTNGQHQVAKTAQGGGKKSERAIPEKRERKKEQKKKKGLGFPTLILALCVFGGVAALIVLRILANAI